MYSESQTEQHASSQYAYSSGTQQPQQWTQEQWDEYNAQQAQWAAWQAQQQQEVERDMGEQQRSMDKEIERRLMQGDVEGALGEIR